MKKAQAFIMLAEKPSGFIPTGLGSRALHGVYRAE